MNTAKTISPKISFVLYVLTILACLFFNPFSEKSPTGDITQFENNFRKPLDDLTDSLYHKTESDTSYFIEWRMGYPDRIFFEYADSNGNKLGYEEPPFIPDKKLIHFFVDAGVREISYIQQYQCFVLIPGYLQNNNKSTTVVIFMGRNFQGDIQNFSTRKKKFQNGNYVYY